MSNRKTHEFCMKFMYVKKTKKTLYIAFDLILNIKRLLYAQTIILSTLGELASSLPLTVWAAVQSTWSIKCNNMQPQLIFQQVIQLSNWSCNLWTLGLLCAKIKLGLLQDQWDDFLNGISHVWRPILTGGFFFLTVCFKVARASLPWKKR